MSDDIIFKKVIHAQSGREFDMGYLRFGNFIETLGMDGPKLIMQFDDPDRYIRDIMRVKELDDFSVSMSDDWAMDGLEGMAFTLLRDPGLATYPTFSLLATPTFRTKKLKGSTKVFRQKKVEEIIKDLTGGPGVDADPFPIVEDYHCIASERPSATLKQLAKEKGAHIWLQRKTWKMRTFAKMWSEPPSFEYHHQKGDESFQIISFSKPSHKSEVEEVVTRGFTGWNDVKGRISVGGGSSKISSSAPSIFSSQHKGTLGNLPVAYRIAIDFIAHGNGHLKPGMVLKLWWHVGLPEQPLDESLPDKIVIQSVAHYYSAQKYYNRVRGAVPLGL